MKKIISLMQVGKKSFIGEVCLLPPPSSPLPPPLPLTILSYAIPKLPLHSTPIVFF